MRSAASYVLRMRICYSEAVARRIDSAEVVRTVDRVWTLEHAAELRIVRRSIKQSQAECGRELRGLGGTQLGQVHVSRIETGEVKRPWPRNQRAIGLYVERHRQTPPEPPKTPPGDADDSTDFDDIVRGATGEPLLGPLQAMAVRAVIGRLEHGPPMSESDESARAQLWRTLGLSG